MNSTEAIARLESGEARLMRNRIEARRAAWLWRAYDLLDAARREVTDAAIAIRSTDRERCHALLDQADKIVVKIQRVLDVIGRVHRIARPARRARLARQQRSNGGSGRRASSLPMQEAIP